MTRISFIVFLCVVCASVTGCGTVATHVMSPSERPPGTFGLYRGTKFDALMLNGICKSKEAEVWGYGVVFGPIVICDLPLSVVADTIMLPFDVFSNAATNAP